MKLNIFLINIFVFIAVTSCNNVSNEDCTSYDYSDCNTIEPDSASLSIKLTINAENNKVPISIYKGKYEDGELILVDSISETGVSYYLPVNNYYTVRAKYKLQNKTIYAIDGDNIKLKKNYICDSTCWKVKNADADVRLK